MRVSRITLRAFWLSVALHVVIGLFLVANLSFTPKLAVQPHVDVDIVEATKVDADKVEKELERFREEERKKEEDRRRQEEEQKQKAAEAERKVAEAEQKRKAEEKRLQELEQKKLQEQKAREVEQKRLEDLKKQQQEVERQRKLEEEKKQKAAEEAARLKKEADERRKAEEEKQRKAEEEKKRKAAEEALRKQMAEEEARRAAQQAAADNSLLAQYQARLKAAIQQEFNVLGLPPGLSCILLIRMVPGGEVVSVKVEKSSGNPIFDRRAELAVEAASPLPVPEDPRLFELMRDVRFNFSP